MKIKKFEFNLVKKEHLFGLDENSKPMRDLGNIVVLVGKNGSGKTRILKCIQSIVENAKDYSDPKKIQFEKDIEQIKAWMFVEGDPEKASADIKDINIKLDKYYPLKTENRDELGQLKIVSFFPKKTDLHDWSKDSYEKWITKAEKCYKGGTEYLADCSTALIQKVVNQYWVAKRKVVLKEGDEIYDKYTQLQDYFKILFESKNDLIDFDENGKTILFGQPIASLNLSEGQRLMIQLCVALFAQGAQINDFILLIDEPELHLHPSVAIKFLDQIADKNKNGQIWIATHSLAIASHFDSSCVWHIENSKVSFGKKKASEIVDGLLGNDVDTKKLMNFISFPNKQAVQTFSLECLQNPAVAFTNTNDPQFIQIKSLLKDIQNGDGCLSVLDYGAGRGRIIASFAEDHNFSTNTLDYYAFCPCSSVEDEEYCLSSIKQFYDNECSNRFISNENELLNNKKSYFDIVILCNVLHEIDVTKWLGVMRNIKSLLKDDGCLLFVEDCQIPVGELPVENGFVVLNTEQLEKLFNTAREHFLISDYSTMPGAKKGYEQHRLMAHLIPKSIIEKVDETSIRAALDNVKDVALNTIKEIREKSKYSSKEDLYTLGLKHAFWLQQYANASLNMELN